MRNSMITVIATLSLIVAVPAHAAGKSSKQEQIGASSGAIVGAVTGGPIGFIVGAAIGAKIGDNAHKKNERIDGLQASLAASDGEVKVLRSDITSLTGEIDRLQDFARPELVSLMQAGIAMDLLFRTDEAVLADTTGSRLHELATTLASMPARLTDGGTPTCSGTPSASPSAPPVATSARIASRARRSATAIGPKSRPDKITPATNSNVNQQ